jgi:NAD(P) transhydrogenase subunit beta
MPILNVDQAQNVIVLKRGRGTGFAGIPNPLFSAENTSMLFGDAKPSVEALVQGVKTA